MAARKRGNGFTLDGIKLFVNDAHIADYLLVAARTGGKGITLFAIEDRARGNHGDAAQDDGLDPQAQRGEVRQRQGERGGCRRMRSAMAGRPLAEILDRGKVMIAAEMMGGAQKVLDMSVEYAKVRVQFGRPIGSFQAVQHKCANMMMDVEGAKSAVYYAAWAVSNDVAEAPLAAALCKAAASDAYRRVSADGIQIHGGIGFTWDHDMHLYFKRAKSSEFTFGDATYNRELVAQGINL